MAPAVEVKDNVNRMLHVMGQIQHVGNLRADGVPLAQHRSTGTGLNSIPTFSGKGTFPFSTTGVHKEP